MVLIIASRLNDCEISNFSSVLMELSDQNIQLPIQWLKVISKSVGPKVNSLCYLYDSASPLVCPMAQ